MVKSRLATRTKNKLDFQTHIFDIRARVNSNNIAVLDTEVVSDNAVDAGATIIEVIISQDNQHSVLALLALD
jgi:hypothetical protein